MFESYLNVDNFSLYSRKFVILNQIKNELFEIEKRLLDIMKCS